jgi:hypothetical protein
MNRKTIYTDAPKSVAENIMAGEVMPDFLPPPEQLRRKTSKVKLTATRDASHHEQLGHQCLSPNASGRQGGTKKEEALVPN